MILFPVDKNENAKQHGYEQAHQSQYPCIDQIGHCPNSKPGKGVVRFHFLFIKNIHDTKIQQDYASPRDFSSRYLLMVWMVRSDGLVMMV